MKTTVWMRREIIRLSEAVHFSGAEDGRDVAAGHDSILTKCEACDDLRAKLLAIVEAS